MINFKPLSLAAFTSIFLSSSASFAVENPRPEQDGGMEICMNNTTDAACCMIPVHTQEFGERTVYVVRTEQDYEFFAGLFPYAIFFLVDDQTEYDSVRTFLGVQPFMLQRKAGSAPAPKPTPSTAGGPLISGSVSVGNITIGAGGSAGCADCHTGSWKEIHGKALQPIKSDKGK